MLPQNAKDRLNHGGALPHEGFGLLAAHLLPMSPQQLLLWPHPYGTPATIPGAAAKMRALVTGVTAIDPDRPAPMLLIPILMLEGEYLPLGTDERVRVGLVAERVLVKGATRPFPASHLRIGDVQIGGQPLRGLQVLGGMVAAIQRRDLGQLPRVLLHRLQHGDLLGIVGGRGHHLGGYDHLLLAIHRRLGVEAHDVAMTALHQHRLGICQAHCRPLPLAGLGVHRPLLGRLAIRLATVQLQQRGPHPLAQRGRVRQLAGHAMRVALGIAPLLRIHRALLHLLQHALDPRVQGPQLLAVPDLVPRHVRHPRAVDGLEGKVHQAHLHRRAHRLLEEALDRAAVVLQETRQRAVIRMLPAQQPDHGQVLVTQLLQTARRAHAGHEAVQPGRQQHVDIVFQPTARGVALLQSQCRQLQAIHEGGHEAHHVLRRDHLVQTGRQQPYLITRPWPYGHLLFPFLARCRPSLYADADSCNSLHRGRGARGPPRG